MNPIVILTTLLGYLVIGIFFGIESGLRKGDEAKSFKAGQFDQRSTQAIGLAYLVSIPALLVSWLLNFLKTGLAPVWIGWIGVALALAGLLMRRWANRVLGAFYTRTLKVADGQFIIQNGPYRLIRHPGYLGSILMWVGAAIATSNWIVTLIVLVAMLAAYHYRMNSEEAMLLETQKDYAEYCKHTKRLLPFIY